MEKEAKIYILGATAVLISAAKLEDWKRVEKYAPDIMKIKDDCGEISFFIQTGEGGGSVTEEGISWGSYTSREGYATVTVLLDKDVENKKEAVTEVMGKALINLMSIEKALPQILDDIRVDETKIGGQIVEI